MEAFVRICGGVAADGEPPLVHGLARTDAVIALGRSARRGDAAALRAIMARLADADVEAQAGAVGGMARPIVGGRPLDRRCVRGTPTVVIGVSVVPSSYRRRLVYI